MYFVDEVEIYVKGGDGGDGCVSFLREKFRPYGGPAGGNGGKGGDVIIRATSKYNTLSHLRNRKKIIAKNGENGKGKNCYGKDAPALVIEVPPGTIIKDKKTNLILKESMSDNEEIVIAKGGRGGRGNAAFKSSTCQAPTKAEKGEKGEERFLILELKLLADAGLLGLPNAGKSTLLSKISNARPKIASYPFTTKAPILGLVKISDFKHIVVADLPGIIEGASRGKGLGLHFLKHIEKTRVIVYLLDVSIYADVPPIKAFFILENELRKFNPKLLTRPSMIVANKIDLEGADKNIKDIKKTIRKPVYPISALKGEGISKFIADLSKII
ncbi:MAG: GTPase ObgE [Planctomycetota bacterium]